MKIKLKIDRLVNTVDGRVEGKKGQAIEVSDQVGNLLISRNQATEVKEKPSKKEKEAN